MLQKEITIPVNPFGNFFFNIFSLKSTLNTFLHMNNFFFVKKIGGIRNDIIYYCAILWILDRSVCAHISQCMLWPFAGYLAVIKSNIIFLVFDTKQKSHDRGNDTHQKGQTQTLTLCLDVPKFTVFSFFFIFFSLLFYSILLDLNGRQFKDKRRKLIVLSNWFP